MIDKDFQNDIYADHSAFFCQLILRNRPNIQGAA